MKNSVAKSVDEKLAQKKTIRALIVELFKNMHNDNLSQHVKTIIIIQQTNADQESNAGT